MNDLLLNLRLNTKSYLCQEKEVQVSVTHDMSGFVAHDLSGLRWSPVEVTDETDGDTTGEPKDAI
jgi:hypothetical protein